MGIKEIKEPQHPDLHLQPDWTHGTEASSGNQTRMINFIKCRERAWSWIMAPKLVDTTYGNEISGSMF
jgi:hypothetical protein